jgi:hypothetical protein
MSEPILTGKEQEIAIREGWRLTAGGSLTRVFDASGNSIHSSSYMAYKFVLSKAIEGSDMHRRAYLETPWNPIDDAIAREHGWRLTQNDILRISNRYFDNDQQASQFVANKASEGGHPVYLKAIWTLTRRKLLMDS